VETLVVHPSQVIPETTNEVAFVLHVDVAHVFVDTEHVSAVAHFSPVEHFSPVSQVSPAIEKPENVKRVDAAINVVL